VTRNTTKLTHRLLQIIPLSRSTIEAVTSGASLPADPNAERAYPPYLCFQILAGNLIADRCSECKTPEQKPLL
jgi:hypothetical protein